jgi:hypothetical protein
LATRLIGRTAALQLAIAKKQHIGIVLKIILIRLEAMNDIQLQSPVRIAPETASRKYYIFTGVSAKQVCLMYLTSYEDKGLQPVPAPRRTS